MTYWKTRYLKGIKKSFNDAENVESYLVKKYDFIIKSIKKELASFYAEFSENNKLTYTEAKRYLTVLQLQSKKEDLELLKLKLKDSNDKEILAKLNKFMNRKKVTRLEFLVTQLESYVSILSGMKEKKLDKHLLDTLDKSYKNSFRSLSAQTVSGIKFSALTENAIKTIIEQPWSGSNYSSNIWRDKRVLTENLKLELVKGFVQGSSYDQVARNLNKKLKGSLNRAKALVRTESNYIIQAANAAAYDRLGINKYEYSAILDDRTSEICKEQDGKIFKVENATPGVNMPPLHVNCRSVILPVF